LSVAAAGSSGCQQHAGWEKHGEQLAAGWLSGCQPRALDDHQVKMAAIARTYTQRSRHHQQQPQHQQPTNAGPWARPWHQVQTAQALKLASATAAPKTCRPSTSDPPGVGPGQGPATTRRCWHQTRPSWQRPGPSGWRAASAAPGGPGPPAAPALPAPLGTPAQRLWPGP
jgi:hypothetical protein